jgi:hypothetical protein
MRAQQRRLVWSFIGSIGLIAAAVGLATMLAHWTGRLN